MIRINGFSPREIPLVNFIPFQYFSLKFFYLFFIQRFVVHLSNCLNSVMIFLKIFFFFLLSLTIFSQEKFYYTGKNYGSEALFNPVNVILNGSYDIIQLEGRPRDIFNYDYEKNTRFFFRDLGRPLYSISKYGYWNFIKNEV